jgi:haloalkane dehalogenase
MESQYFNVNGMRINALVAGNEQHPGLLLLHGYPTSSQLWRRIIPGLADRFRVIAPDLPGHGRSDKPMDVAYDSELFTGFLCGLADTLSLRRFSLVGHDLGGMAALCFAARFPERLQRLVIMDTAPYADWSLPVRVVIWLARNRLTGRLLLTRPLFRGFMRLGVAQPRVITSELAEQFRHPRVADEAGRRAFSLTVAAPPEQVTVPRHDLARISMPTLVLWAARDRLFGKRIARRLCGDLPQATMTVVPDCGHFLQEEQPELILHHLQSFLGPGLSPP